MRLTDFAVAIGCTALVGGMSPAVALDASSQKYYAKRGVTPERFDVDLNSCIAEVKKAYFEPAMSGVYTPYQPGLAGAAVTGLASGMARGKIKSEAIVRTGDCMKQKKGYKLAPMTAKQFEAWSQLNSEQRKKAARVLAGGGNLASLLSN
jgi:hypothetical protein